MWMHHRKDEGVRIITVSGRVDAESSPQFDENCKKWIIREDELVILDLGGLDYISSSGLRSLLFTAKRIKSWGGRMILVSVHGSVREVLEISGLLSLFKVSDTVESALTEVP